MEVNIKKILFPTDFTEGSMAVRSLAADLVKRYGAKLYLLHVVFDVTKAAHWYVPHANIKEFYKEATESAKKQLERFMMEEMRGYGDIEQQVIMGEPAEEILRIVEEKGIDLIVMGTHGRKGIDRMFFGSTAEKVVRAARCPVLTVRATR